MNPMQMKTPEERRAIAAKSHATQRRNREEEVARRRDALTYAGGLREEILELERTVGELRRADSMRALSAQLTGKTLLREKEIIESALPWERAIGVYFLIKDGEVVYVGQSTNIYARITQHWSDVYGGKEFDSYAYVLCDRGVLDRLESLYIHCLQPRFNGQQNNGAKCAPLTLEKLIGDQHG